MLYAEPESCPVVYGRDTEEDSVLVAVNPGGKAVSASFGFECSGKRETILSSPGVDLTVKNGATLLEMPPVSFAVFRVRKPYCIGVGFSD